MCFGFGGANAAADASVGDFVIQWHLLFGDEFNNVSQCLLIFKCQYLGQGIQSRWQGKRSISYCWVP